MFPDIYSSCRGASILRDHTAVDAVEMFDRASLRSAAAWLCWECASVRTLTDTPCRASAPHWLQFTQ